MGFMDAISNAGTSMDLPLSRTVTFSVSSDFCIRPYLNVPSRSGNTQVGTAFDGLNLNPVEINSVHRRGLDAQFAAIKFLNASGNAVAVFQVDPVCKNFIRLCMGLEWSG